MRLILKLKMVDFESRRLSRAREYPSSSVNDPGFRFAQIRGIQRVHEDSDSFAF